jgi:hypothetical protein
MKSTSLRTLAAGFCMACPFMVISPLVPAQQIEDDTIKFQEWPQTPSKTISKFLNENIDTKEFRQEMPLKKFLDKLQEILEKKGKQVQFVIDVVSFEKENEAWKKEGFDPPPDVRETIIKFPQHPKRMNVGTCLRLALSKVVTNNASYRIKRGLIVITTIERIQNPFFRERVSGNFKNVPLIKVLDELSDISGVSILVDPRIGKQVRTPINARFAQFPPWDGATLETALRLLTDMTELKYVPVGNAIYVTSPGNGPVFAKEYLRRSNAYAKIVEKPMEGNSPEPFQYLDDKIRGTFEKRPLSHILDKLETNAPIIVDRRVNRRAQKPITARFINPVTLETALAVLTDMAGLKYVVVGNAFYVTSPENARRLEKEEEQRNSKEKQKSTCGTIK